MCRNGWRVSRPGLAAVRRPSWPSVKAFPEYYAEYMKRAMTGGTVVPIQPMFCVGPVRYRGEQALKRDLDNLRAALGGRTDIEAFVPSVAPSGVGNNEHYGSFEEYMFAVADAISVE